MMINHWNNLWMLSGVSTEQSKYACWYATAQDAPSVFKQMCDSGDYIAVFMYDDTGKLVGSSYTSHMKEIPPASAMPGATETNALEWAKAFGSGDMSIKASALAAWFACAIEAGRIAGRQRSAVPAIPPVRVLPGRVMRFPARQSTS